MGGSWVSSLRSSASLVSIRVGISVALIEIGVGIVGGNTIGLPTTPWIDFLASFGAVLLTFLAGAEIDPVSLRRDIKVRPIGGLALPRRPGGAWWPTSAWAGISRPPRSPGSPCPRRQSRSCTP